MVFFTCNLCGESVKKPSVEKHYQQRCRGATKSVSCMDCLKDFYGEEYVAHTKCISEAEKYSGKDYVPKESKNNNARKQETWMDIIRAILESSDYDMSAPVRNAFQRLQSVENVPRKKAKFENFVSNCMRMPKQQAEQVWKILEKELEKMKQARQAEVAANKAAQLAAKEAKQQNGTKREAPPTENGHEANDEPAKKKATQKNGTKQEAPPTENGHEANDEPVKKKSKKQNGTKQEAPPTENGHEANEEPAKKKSKKQASTEPATNGTQAADAVNNAAEDGFEWNDVLAKIVAKHEEGILLDKLRKKLLKKYTKKLEIETLTEKQERKFEKKLKKHLKRCASVQLVDNLVKAC